MKKQSKTAPDLFTRVESAGYGVFIGKTAADDAEYLRGAASIPASKEKTERIRGIADRVEEFVRKHPGDLLRRGDVSAIRNM